MLSFGIPATIFKGKMIPNYIIDSSKYPVLKMTYTVKLSRGLETIASCTLVTRNLCG